MIRPYDSIPQALNDVVAGAIDGAIVDVVIASSYCENIYKGQLKIVTPPLNDLGLRLLTRVHETPQLMRAFNEGLAELKLAARTTPCSRNGPLGQGFHKEPAKAPE